MQHHRFDPISAILGLFAVALGLVVALGGSDRVDTNGGTWLAVLGLGAGAALLPWGRRRT